LRACRDIAALLTFVTPAFAFATERPTVMLEYEREGRTAQECPDEATFRALVAAKLGYDPFAKEATKSLRVTFSRTGAGLSGNLTLTVDGTLQGKRTLRAGGSDCHELAASLALAAAVASDPDAVAHGAPEGDAKPSVAAGSLSDPASAAEPPQPPRAPVANPVNSETAPRSPSGGPDRTRQTIGARITAGGFIPFGLTPGLTGGARLGVGLDAGSWLLALEGGATLDSTKDSGVGRVSAHTVDAALVPCVEPALAPDLTLALCAVGRLGFMRSAAEGVTRSTPTSDLVATLGPRVGVEVFPWRVFGVGVEAELPISLARVHLLIDDQGRRREVWASARAGMIPSLVIIFRP
jgi:hypothetical protein